MQKLIIKRLVNSPVNSNCFIIHQKGNQDCLIIDPGSKNISELTDYLELQQLIPSHIIITHYHFDHIWGVDRLVELYNSKVISSKVSAIKVTNRKHNLSAFYEDFGFTIAAAEILIENINFELSWNNRQIKFYDTRGHSDGCISILIEQKLFSGDSLIKDVEIPTKLPGGSTNDLASTYNLFHKLLDENPMLKVYPGHGEIFELDRKDLELNKYGGK